jgi:catechol 2,3-dioxygenase-like lactoylglutathione lyase family enzyme
MDMQDAPAPAGIHHLKLPVTDLARSREWYQTRLGYRVQIEFVEQGRLMGYALEHPNGGPPLALRLDPERARAAAGFDYFAIGVPGKETIEQLAARLTALGGSARGFRGWHEAELFEHLKLVVHQVGVDAHAVTEALHLDVAGCDAAAGGRDVAGRGVQDAIVGAGEGALLDSDIAGDMQGVDLHVRVGEGAEPFREELGAGLPPLTAHPAWRMKYDVVREHVGELADVMGVEASVPLSNASRTVMVIRVMVIRVMVIRIPPRQIFS